MEPQGALPKKIWKRLLGREMFQSARYELAVAGICARAGLRIRFIDDKTRRQPGFIATALLVCGGSMTKSTARGFSTGLTFVIADHPRATSSDRARWSHFPFGPRGSTVFGRQCKVVSVCPTTTPRSTMGPRSGATLGQRKFWCA